MTNLQKILFEIAKNANSQGPGYSTEIIVLNEAFKQLNANNIKKQQQILTAWNDLFRDGILDWGYDLNVIGSPFFFIPPER